MLPFPALHIWSRGPRWQRHHRKPLRILEREIMLEIGETTVSYTCSFGCNALGVEAGHAVTVWRPFETCRTLMLLRQGVHARRFLRGLCRVCTCIWKKFQRVWLTPGVKSVYPMWALLCFLRGFDDGDGW